MVRLPRCSIWYSTDSIWFMRLPSRHGIHRVVVRLFESLHRSCADRRHSSFVRMPCPACYHPCTCKTISMPNVTFLRQVSATYVLFVVGKRDASLNSLILFFQALLASSVGLMYLIPLRSQFLITSLIHLPCTSMVVGPLESRVGP